MTRGRGRLRWQEQNDSPQDIVHQGNEAALTQYICDNRAELENTLRRLKQEEAFERAHTSEFPITFDEWMQYLDKNDSQFRNLMVEANKQRRRLSERISSGEDMSAMLRVCPVPCPERGHSPEWSHLGAGLFGFGLKGEMSRITVFSASIGNIVYACRLYATYIRLFGSFSAHLSLLRTSSPLRLCYVMPSSWTKTWSMLFRWIGMLLRLDKRELCSEYLVPLLCIGPPPHAMPGNQM